MSLPTFAAQTVTVLRATTVTDHGSERRNWSSPTLHDIAGCVVVPVVGAEDEAHRDAITTVQIVHAPVGADVVDTDRVRVAGVVYDIDGPVRRFESGVLDHLEIPLRHVEG